MFLSVQGSLLWEHNAVNFVQVLVILDGIGLYTWIYPGTLSTWKYTSEQSPCLPDS